MDAREASSDAAVTGVMSCNVYAEDFAASARFYGEVLGLRRAGDMGPHACFFEIAGRRHGLFLEGGYRRAPADERDARASFTLEVRSAFELHRRLVDSGCTMLQAAPQDMGNATFWFQFRDPAGNIVEAIGPR